jgi:hypothetical protein
MARRNRIIYPSNSVWANGQVLYRVQTFGSTTTFNTEDVFELGKLSIIDVVDDSPTVAVTLEANEFGSLSNLYALANLEQDDVLVHNATSVSGHLTVVSGLGDDAVNIAYYHGVTLSDFGLSSVCGNSSVEIWAPIQNECSIGTADTAVDQTMYLPRVFINSIEWTYTAGANATENYGGETDAKFWFVNDGKFISNEEFVYTSAGAGTHTDPNDGTTGGTGYRIPTGTSTVYLGLDQNASPAERVSVRTTGQLAFLRFDSFGTPSVRYYNASTNGATEIPVVESAVAAATTGAYVYHAATNSLIEPSDLISNAEFGITEGKEANDILIVVYAANRFARSFATLQGATQAARGGATAPTSNMATRRDAEYFVPVEIDPAHKPEDLGAVRQGQVELYLIDKDVLGPDFNRDLELALRVTSATIAADLTREPLFELSHLRPYDRALTFPIPFTVTIESTANDLIEYATLASKKTGVLEGTTDEISIYDFMTANNRLDLVVHIYQQTDEEAGGVGSNRRVVTREMVGDEYYQRGQRYIYYDGTGSDPDGDPTGSPTEIPAVPSKTNTHRERPLKTIIAKNLRITDEAYNLSLGENASQTYGFRGTNEVFAVLGEATVADLVADPGIQVNPNHKRLGSGTGES